jgi:hypothetical protein
MCDSLQPNRRDPYGKCFSFRKAGAGNAKNYPSFFCAGGCLSGFHAAS